jgi:hypothetical protein
LTQPSAEADFLAVSFRIAGQIENAFHSLVGINASPGVKNRTATCMQMILDLNGLRKLDI